MITPKNALKKCRFLVLFSLFCKVFALVKKVLGLLIKNLLIRKCGFCVMISGIILCSPRVYREIVVSVLT